VIHPYGKNRVRGLCDTQLIFSVAHRPVQYRDHLVNLFFGYGEARMNFKPGPVGVEVESIVQHEPGHLASYGGVSQGLFGLLVLDQVYGRQEAERTHLADNGVLRQLLLPIF
jgi:hypothetical protein